MKKAYLHATKHPCTENAMNLNLLRRWFGGNDWEMTSDPSNADVIVVSTCGFSREQEDYEIGVIAKLGKIRKPDARLVVLGCLPKINRERLEGVFRGDTVPTDKIEKMDEILDLPKKTWEFENHTVSREEYSTDPRISRFFNIRRKLEILGDSLPFINVPPVLFTVPSERWWCVRCAMGCTGNCSYCGIRHAHGPFRSEPVDEIISQVKQGLQRGHGEIALTGEDLGGYGVDIGTDLADLLAEIVSLPGDFAVNIRFIDPYWLIRLRDKLMPVFATGKIKAFCAPAQSGSNRILKLMNRRYSYEELKDTVNAIVRNTPVDLVSTNIIVGFPGETRDEIAESMRLIRDIDFGMYMIFRYEDRPGTVASGLPGKISEAEKEKRYQILHRRAVIKHGTELFKGFAARFRSSR
ncbi:MAG: hypothetical protein CVV64_10180 [Candidatus Wallbacteria bacterium HGW-Wallbacteria-1]|jgi:tRNA A37 methylthiotransferase MiaB|uniref:Uncharacterized protein n=1 Tax=Candidatus Wallbacteria bacterium HGW-Wallbacteria-1 TaxID=2013854 RepID=A0A2N1PPQ8_9BACT|nr:MAG: hypothetical protein CVV64_10180 [Candidatus Wallbacteria bacterium HGW-Wallbacteria-1]